jgi:hypothetical protein
LIRNYHGSEEKLFDKYVKNRKVKYRISTNFSPDPNSQLGTAYVFGVVHGQDASRSNNLTDPGLLRPIDMTGKLELSNETYVLQAGEKSGTHKIGSHRLKDSPSKHGAAMSAGGPATLPLTYMDSLCQTSVRRILDANVGSPPDGQYCKLVGVRSTEWRGRPAVEAKFEEMFGIVNLLYLDPANDYAFLGFDSDGMYDHKVKAKSPIRLTGWMTYKPSTEGFPLPERFETWSVHPDGKRSPHSLTEVIEYVKYTPTADDFDLEKQFGVRPLPPGTPVSAMATSGGQSWRWLYAGAAVLALVTVALVVLTRRRRKMAA